MSNLKKFGLSDDQIKKLFSAVALVISKCPIENFMVSDINKLKTFFPVESYTTEPILDENLNAVKEGNYPPPLLMQLPDDQIYILEGNNLLKAASSLGISPKVKIIKYQDIEALKLGISPVFDASTTDLIRNQFKK